jgi:hypothetical protein
MNWLDDLSISRDLRVTAFASESGPNFKLQVKNLLPNPCLSQGKREELNLHNYVSFFLKTLSHAAKPDDGSDVLMMGSSWTER